MELSATLYCGLVAGVALLRLAELRLSRRHQERLAARGALKIGNPGFRWMVLVHAAILLGSPAEVVFLRRPLLPRLAISMLLLFLAANAVRWWVIATLGEHWNVQVVDSTRLGVITTGPFRFVRHPNYAAVFAEMLALPLIHTAWLTALLGALAHLVVLAQRLALEDPVLLAHPEYRAAMASKPRFLPGLF
jgi:methyltransferase